MGEAEGLRALLGRVEAEESSQALDAWVVWAAVAPKGAEVVTGPITGETRIRVGKYAFTGADIVWSEWPDWRDARPTASIDAAVALVERVLPGWHRAIYSRGLMDESTASAQLEPPGFDGPPEVGIGATEALALVSATLRALIAQAEPPPARGGGPADGATPSGRGGDGREGRG